MIHKDVKITHPDKPIWDHINKTAYLSYLADLSPYLLPFLRDRFLTVIRFPSGIKGEAFYQKHVPPYAPSFIQTHQHKENSYILCNDLSTLLWLGNQLALEFHISFRTVNEEDPLEIVFDLDPPSRESFPLAILAAMEMKRIFDQFQIKSYPKLTGNKGLHIHIPIVGSGLSFDDTRIFTSFIAKYIVEKNPNTFTTERFKKNRGNKLYVDYVQHADGKTIICPYSARGKEGATVAAPLYWEEVTDTLRIDDFHLSSMRKRISEVGCPFSNYFQQKNEQVAAIITALKNHDFQ